MKKTKKRNSKKKKIDNSDLPDLIKGLTRKQLEQVAKEYFKEKRENKNKNIDKTKKKLSFLTISELARLLNVCRTNFYKKKVTRKYKYDNFKKVIVQEFNANKSIYGRLRLSIILKQKHNIDINSRTLGHYLNRYGCYCKIRIAKKKRELKQLNVSYPDLVQRNYNPQKDNIIATDVSYIRADEHNNFVYLSIAINHKSKLIESWELSTKNNDKLVYDTMKKIRHIDNLIVHSDHGAPYSSDIIVKLSKQRKYKISMSRVGNSLDNREAEYFFSCIKSECLKFVRTSTMKIATIKKVIKKYIS